MPPEPVIPSEAAFQGQSGSAEWAGRVISDAEAFEDYLRGSVRERVRDTESGFEAELSGLATTRMATEFLAEFLTAIPTTESWEIGEALAELLLASDSGREICWPWNTVRDRRTPRASLPGADLVGFCRHGGTTLLLFGEVKTSSEASAPPGVMHGGSGMAWQLGKQATRLDVQHSLLRWLRHRCQEPRHIELYREAVTRYLQSQGQDVLLVGVLARDTQPDERDVSGRARALARELPSTRIELLAWYFPVPIAAWERILEGGP